MKRFFCFVFVAAATLASAAFAQSKPAQSAPAQTVAQPESKLAQTAPRKQDRSAAYYHYALAHMYEEQVTVYGRSELANKAIEEYRQAI